LFALFFVFLLFFCGRLIGYNIPIHTTSIEKENNKGKKHEDISQIYWLDERKSFDEKDRKDRKEGRINLKLS